MPFFNTDEPAYALDEPPFLRAKKKAAFGLWVQSAIDSESLSDERFKEIVHLRWQSFAQGSINEDTVMVDVISAHRAGYNVNLQAAYENFLDCLKKSQNGV